jgi:hypothetical protein
VSLTSNPSGGATFGTTQFASVPVTTVTIPSGQSTATFWYGSTATGTPTITASAPGYASGTQLETITTAPVGLGMGLASGSTGSPVIACGAVNAAGTCNVTGVGAAGQVAFIVTLWDSNQGPAVYSATQPSVVDETGQNTGKVTIPANGSGSGRDALSASVGTSTLTFGPYVLTINVSA